MPISGVCPASELASELIETALVEIAVVERRRLVAPPPYQMLDARAHLPRKTLWSRCFPLSSSDFVPRIQPSTNAGASGGWMVGTSPTMTNRASSWMSRNTSVMIEKFA